MHKPTRLPEVGLRRHRIAYSKGGPMPRNTLYRYRLFRRIVSLIKVLLGLALLAIKVLKELLDLLG